MYTEYMDGFSGNETFRDGDLVTSKKLRGIWKILPRYPQSILHPWLENPTGRELGGMRIERVLPKPRVSKKKFVSRASLTRVDSIS